jgi:repressor LexA
LDIKDFAVKKPLTERQKKVLEIIEDQIRSGRGAPTIREIGQRLGISSTNGVRVHLTALIKKGYLKKAEFVSRGLSLARDLSHGIGRVPLVGSAPAGSPIDAIENIEGEIAVDDSFLPSGDSFTLTVTGDSMKDAGILDGDMILVKKQAVARKGEIVVAIINGEATIKKYYPEGKTIRLQPENKEFEPIIVSKQSGEFRIAGKVVALMRKMD